MSVAVQSYLLLMLAVCLEVVATSALKSSHQFTRFWPSLFVIVGYAASFYCLSLVLRHMAVGVAYAIWCALGMVLVPVIAFFVYKQRLDLPAVIGIGFIVVGVLIINIFSKNIYQN